MQDDGEGEVHHTFTGALRAARWLRMTRLDTQFREAVLSHLRGVKPGDDNPSNGVRAGENNSNGWAAWAENSTTSGLGTRRTPPELD
jgi:hypothetical protein